MLKGSGKKTSDFIVWVNAFFCDIPIAILFSTRHTFISAAKWKRTAARAVQVQSVAALQ